MGGAPLGVVKVETTEEKELERQLESLPQCQTFVGVGGGQAVDMAKYFSWRRGSGLVVTHCGQCGCFRDTLCWR